MKPDVRREQVQAQIDVAAARLAEQYPSSDAVRSARVTALDEVETREARKPLLILWATAVLVLLLACVNFTSLCLSRGLARQREASVRLALGAGTFRLVRLYLTESMVMALIGGLAGLGAAYATLAWLISSLPADLPNAGAIALNSRVVAVTILVSLTAGLLAGWVPAWRIAHNATAERLTDRGGTSRRDSLWIQKSLLACQIALSVVLLTGATLLTHSLLRLTSEPLGFQPAHVLAVKIGLSWDTPEDRLNGFSKQALEGFRAIPGVRAAGLIDRLPLTGGSQTGTFKLPNRPMPDGRETAEVSLRATAGNYFAAAGIPLIRGRFLSERATGEEREVLVNQAFAARYFKNSDPLDQSIQVNGLHTKHHLSRIVGVIADVRQESTREAPPEVFVQADTTFWPILTFVLRGEGDPRGLASGVREVIRKIDSSESIDSIVTLEDSVVASRTQPRLRAIAFGAFATVAILLAALGIYGLQSQTVSQRGKEIALRLALGARPSEAVLTILKQNIGIMCLGLVLGVGAATALAMLLKTLIYGVPALDPVAFVAGEAGLALTALAASLIPARRATSVDPASTLRHE